MRKVFLGPKRAGECFSLIEQNGPVLGEIVFTKNPRDCIMRLNLHGKFIIITSIDKIFKKIIKKIKPKADEGRLISIAPKNVLAGGPDS